MGLVSYYLTFCVVQGQPEFSAFASYGLHIGGQHTHAHTHTPQSEVVKIVQNQRGLAIIIIFFIIVYPHRVTLLL